MARLPNAKGFAHLSARGPSLEQEESAVAYEATIFFDHIYKYGNDAALTDRDTIGPSISQLDSRFHFNSVENALLRALARAEPIPARGVLVRGWEYSLSRRGHRLFDVGSGAGHWIAFFREIGFVSEVVGCEISSRALSHLRRRFAETPGVSIIEHDIAAAPLSADQRAGGFDYVSAIGVMFHIVEDECWQRALIHVAEAVKPGGLVFVGGEFGHVTRNVQFHADDRNPLRGPGPGEAAYRVSKRVRALADWQGAAGAAGLEIVDLIRTGSDPAFVTPENDLLVLRRVALPGRATLRR